ncbi:unnamed protein product [Ambrosiozyma monospora]|uniref:Unnamed protein product n=1 Tax=Ambrosiozyma monospora TaxID=43982 RepID=A0A9W6WI74_AMBMO|nr:unnamed protein product [Ambrosiozyma monospora]
MALFLLMNAFSAAISEAISAVLVDPHLIWPFTGMAAAGGFFSLCFLIHYWNLDKVMAKEALERERALQDSFGGLGEKKDEEEDEEADLQSSASDAPRVQH